MFRAVAGRTIPGSTAFFQVKMDQFLSPMRAFERNWCKEDLFHAFLAISDLCMHSFVRIDSLCEADLVASLVRVEDVYEAVVEVEVCGVQVQLVELSHVGFVR